VLAQLPDVLPIYRGIGSVKGRNGLSWTLDRERAIFFAQRFVSRLGGSSLLTARACKSDVHALLLGRNDARHPPRPTGKGRRSVPSSARSRYFNHRRQGDVSLGVFAEFERGIIRERVNAGLARARANGTKLGRRRVDPAVEARILELKSGGDGILRIGRKLGVGTSVVQRVVRGMPKTVTA
jgi:hypothetical protein